MTSAQDAQRLTFEQAQADVYELSEQWATVELVQVGGWRSSTPWYFAIDTSQIESLGRIRWHQSGGRVGTTGWYAKHPTTGRALHRLLMLESGLFQIDHANGNTLDNRRINLRRATPRQNNQNRGKSPGASSRFKGVSRSARGLWQVAIVVDGRVQNLGRYIDEEYAAWVYDQAARMHYGRYARLNHVARPEADRTPRKPRYSHEERTIALVLASEIGTSAAARQLDICPSSINNWQRQLRVQS